MESFLLALVSALWLGILTSISPCPLATNVAAISFIGNKISRPSTVFLSGLLYILGRMLTYIVIAIIIVASAVTIPKLSLFLQNQMNKIMGPLLIIVGIFLLGAFRFSFGGSKMTERVSKKMAAWGFWGALPMGVVFALSFCPVSAALFFGSLLPLALQHQSSVILPTAYGIGTALPVIVFAVIIALGAHSLGTAFNRLTKFELWARRITGVVFILAGIYYILAHILKVKVWG
jgi:cytochrome c-type biogenesis protein